MRTFALAVLAMTFPVVAAAQTRPPAAQPPAVSGWNGPFRISVNFGAQLNAVSTIAQTFSVTKYVEPAGISADIDAKRASLIDIGAAYRVSRTFAVMFAYSWTSRDTTGTVTAQVPHPFFFDRARTISGTTPINESSRAAHISAAYVVPAHSVELMLFGGPSFFSVSQGLVTDVQFRDEYPYEQANITFTGAPTTLADKSAVGFNAGADLAVKITQNIGVGVVSRYSRAATSVSGITNHAVDVTGGGLQIGAGLRVAF